MQVGKKIIKLPRRYMFVILSYYIKIVVILVLVLIWKIK